MELGVRGRMERLNLDVVGFYNRYSNLIEDARLIERTPLKQVFQTVNIMRAKIYGFEVEGTTTERPKWIAAPTGRLRSSFSYGQTRVGCDQQQPTTCNLTRPAVGGAARPHADRACTPTPAITPQSAIKTLIRSRLASNKAGTTQFATPQPPPWMWACMAAPQQRAAESCAEQPHQPKILALG